LHINSPGGAAIDGVTMYNAVRDHPASVEVTVGRFCSEVETPGTSARPTRRPQISNDQDQLQEVGNRHLLGLPLGER
jgi:hypothetical protein